MPPRRSSILPVLAAVAVAALIVGGGFWLARRGEEEQRTPPEVLSALPLPPLSESITSSQLIERGDAAFAGWQLRRARDAYERAWRGEGDQRAVRRLLSVLLLLGEFDAAEELLQQLMRASLPRHAIVPLQGLLALQRGNLDVALGHFRDQGESPEGAYGMALVALLREDHDLARVHFQRSLEIAFDPLLRADVERLLSAYDEFDLFEDGKRTHLLTLLARALSGNQECRLARELLGRVVVEDPLYRDAWIIAGYCALALELPDEAVRSFEEALALDPVKAETQYFLAMAYASRGDLERAYAQMRFAIVNHVQPETDARLRLAEYAERLGRYGEALDQYEQVLEIGGGQLRLFVAPVRLAIVQMRRPDLAEGIARRAIASSPDAALALDLLGWALLASGRLQEAAVVLERAVNRDGELPSAWYHLGLAQERSGETAASLASFRRAYEEGNSHQDYLTASLASDRYNALITSP